MSIEEFLCDFSKDECGRPTPRYALLDEITRDIVISAWREADTLARKDCADLCESQSRNATGSQFANLIRATIHDLP